MEFKNRQKKRVSFGTKDKTTPVNNASKKPASWLDDEDQDWADLVAKVGSDQKLKKQRRKKDFSKYKQFIKGRLDPLKTWPKKLFTLAKSSPRYTVVSLIGLILIGSLVIKILPNHNDEKATKGASTQQNPNNLPREKPTFKILYPGTKTETTVGEIVRITPSNVGAAYTYVDNLGSSQLNITQQELPDKFKANQNDELKKLAENFQAKSVIKVDSITVYHGESASGAQSLLFIKGNLLVTIKATQKLSDDTWAAYVSALHS